MSGATEDGDDAGALLDGVRTVLDDLLALLAGQRANAVLPGVRNLRAMADEPGTPEAVLARLDRSYWSLMGIPDGLSALYFPGPGGVDRPATDRLAELRAEVSGLLRRAAQRREASE